MLDYLRDDHIWSSGAPLPTPRHDTPLQSVAHHTRHNDHHISMSRGYAVPKQPVVPGTRGRHYRARGSLLFCVCLFRTEPSKVVAENEKEVKDEYKEMDESCTLFHRD